MNMQKTIWTLGSIIGAQQAMKAVRGFELNDILGVVGLERRPSVFARTLPALGLVAVSAAIGAGAALLLAPSSGEQLRARLSDGLDDVKNRLDDVKGRVSDKVGDKLSQFDQTHSTHSPS